MDLLELATAGGLPALVTGLVTGGFLMLSNRRSGDREDKRLEAERAAERERRKDEREEAAAIRAEQRDSETAVREADARAAEQSVMHERLSRFAGAALTLLSEVQRNRLATTPPLPAPPFSAKAEQLHELQVAYAGMLAGAPHVAAATAKAAYDAITELLQVARMPGGVGVETHEQAARRRIENFLSLSESD